MVEERDTAGSSDTWHEKTYHPGKRSRAEGVNMNWINLPTNGDCLRHPNLIGADHWERSTWLALIAHCGYMATGGKIAGCKTWTHRQWLALMIEPELIVKQSKLWCWKGEDLMVSYYPTFSEKKTAAQRRAALNTNKKRWKDHQSK